MANKITWTSEDPNYQPFPIWFEQKIASYTDSGNTATANEWTSALAAKEAAMAAANYTAEDEVDGTIITSSVVADVPAFTNIHQLWVQEYDIKISSIEV
jgi:hypothetical protein